MKRAYIYIIGIISLVIILFFILKHNKNVIKEVPYYVSEFQWDAMDTDVMKMPNGKFAVCTYHKNTNTIDVNYLEEEYQKYFLDDGTEIDDEGKPAFPDGYIVQNLYETLEVPTERKTKKGFQRFVCDWIGSLIGIRYENKLNVKRHEYSYGASYIDYMSKKWDLTRKEEYGCNELDYLFLILRNSFGQCADSFLGIERISNEFDEIIIDKVQIGDIGFAYICNENVPGICIGFDKDSNPIFSIMSYVPKFENLKRMTKELAKEYNINIKKYYYCNNILLTDQLEEKNRTKETCGIKDRYFYKFYSTHSAIPFIDKETDGTSKNKDLIIQDIDYYNNQSNYRDLLDKGEWTGDDLGTRWNEEHKRVQEILKEEKQKRIDYIFSIPDVKIVEIYPETEIEIDNVNENSEEIIQLD